MFSTLLTVLPRALRLVGRRFKTPESTTEIAEHSGRSWDYWVWMAALGIGGLVGIAFFLYHRCGGM